MSILLDAKDSFGAVGDNNHDDTDNLQNWINAVSTTGSIGVLPNGQYKITRPLKPHPAGVSLIGASGSGSFSSIIRPAGCAAFDFTDTHHSKISDLMIWPQSNTRPQHYMTFKNCYSHVLNNIRIHLDGGTPPCLGAAICIQTGQNNNLIFRDLIIRSDGRYFPVGITFEMECGTVALYSPDIETCGIGIEWKGGQISIHSIYTERLGISAIKSICSTSEKDPSLSIHGGTLRCDHSAVLLQFLDKCYNFNLYGVVLSSPLSQYQGFRYSGSAYDKSAIYGGCIDLLKWNFTPTYYGS